MDNYAHDFKNQKEGKYGNMMAEIYLNQEKSLKMLRDNPEVVEIVSVPCKEDRDLFQEIFTKANKTINKRAKRKERKRRKKMRKPKKKRMRISRF